jgi:8-oxo-dGTP pyrophosphatase MutT (NUDIX family)
MEKPPKETIRLMLETHVRRSGEPEGLRPAAVLIPLYENDDGVYLIFTRRTQDVEYHKGQISFPGGARDDGDGGTVATALREAHEEVSIPRETVEVLGKLDDYATPSGFLVTPVAGWIPADLELEPHAPEVDEILHVPLEHLLDPRNLRTEIRDTDWGKRRVYFYQWGNETIWGVTGAILKNFLDVIGAGAGSAGETA